MQNAREKCRPIYLSTDARLPSLFTADDEFLLVNWEDISAAKAVDGIHGRLTSEKSFVHQNGRLSVTLLPHESIRFFVSKQ